MRPRQREAVQGERRIVRDRRRKALVPTRAEDECKDGETQTKVSVVPPTAAPGVGPVGCGRACRSCIALAS